MTGKEVIAKFMENYKIPGVNIDVSASGDAVIVKYDEMLRAVLYLNAVTPAKNSEGITFSVEEIAEDPAQTASTLQVDGMIGSSDTHGLGNPNTYVRTTMCSLYPTASQEERIKISACYTALVVMAAIYNNASIDLTKDYSLGPHVLLKHV